MADIQRGTIFLFSIIFAMAGAMAAFANGHDILIRHKRDGRFLVNGKESRVQKQSFQTGKERLEFIENLDKSEMEWEENVNFSADVVVVPGEETPISNDPLLVNQWSISPSQIDANRFKGVDIDVIRAWDITKGSKDIVVYVVDSGVEARDLDFQGQIVGFRDIINSSNTAIDESGHGTHVTSIIAARSGNGHGIAGIVDDVDMVGVRFLDADNAGDSAGAIAAMEFIRQDIKDRKSQNPNAKCIVSNSWGGDSGSKFLEEEMQGLSDFDCLFITSAGNHSRNNDETPYFPCNFALKDNLCVAASDQFDSLTSYSGFGPTKVALLAPGHDILGIKPGSGNPYVSRYETERGTSQAAPHVTGVAVLVWAANPNLIADEVENIIRDSVDVLPAGSEKVASGGRLNAYRAVLMATGQDPDLANRELSSQTKSGSGCSLGISHTTSAQSCFMLILIALAMTSLLGLRRVSLKIRN